MPNEMRSYKQLLQQAIGLGLNIESEFRQKIDDLIMRRSSETCDRDIKAMLMKSKPQYEKHKVLAMNVQSIFNGFKKCMPSFGQ